MVSTRTKLIQTDYKHSFDRVCSCSDDFLSDEFGAMGLEGAVNPAKKKAPEGAFFAVINRLAPAENQN